MRFLVLFHFMRFILHFQKPSLLAFTRISTLAWTAARALVIVIAASYSNHFYGRLHRFDGLIVGIFYRMSLKYFQKIIFFFDSIQIRNFDSNPLISFHFISFFLNFYMKCIFFILERAHLFEWSVLLKYMAFAMCSASHWESHELQSIHISFLFSTSFLIFLYFWVLHKKTNGSC